ncbi:MAG: HprK-related kinase B [Phycisphaerales bacterium]|nr:HprK-related kinase B [Phycisphaerales bacterium]
MSTPPLSIAARLAALRSAYPPVAHCRLNLAGLHVAVESNARDVLAGIAAYYRHYRADDGPRAADVQIALLEAPPQDVDLPLVPIQPKDPRKRLKDEICDLADGRVLRKLQTGMVFYFDVQQGAAIGPCRQFPNQTVNFINNRFIQHHIDRGCAVAHAAAVARGPYGIAIAGVPGRGKSTLALRALDHELNFVSNDALLLRRATSGVALLGVPKFPRINPGTILHNPRLAGLLEHGERVRLEALPAAALWEVEQKYDVDIEAVYGPDRMQLHAELAALLILNWQRAGGPPRFERVALDARPDLLAALTKRVTPNYFCPPEHRRPDFSPTDYLAQLGATPVYEVTGGADFDVAAEWCRVRIAAARA